jgi:2-haloacid dehalogenase
MTKANGRPMRRPVGRPGGRPGGRSIVVFDLGGVLIDWNPRHLYRKLFAGDEAAMEHFLATVCTQHWNERQDAGRSFAEAEAELIRAHPDKAELIRAWRGRFAEMIPGAIDGTVEIVERLHARGVPLYALSNWSRETFPPQRTRFSFFAWFKGIVVSGEEGVIKPDPRIYELLFRRYEISPQEAVFVDDNPANARAAHALGVHGIHFRSPGALVDELAALGLL